MALEAEEGEGAAQEAVRRRWGGRATGARAAEARATTLTAGAAAVA